MRDLWRAVGVISEQSALALVRILGTWTFLVADLLFTVAFPAVMNDWSISVETRAYDLVILMATLVIARTATRQAERIAQLVEAVHASQEAILALAARQDRQDKHRDGQLRVLAAQVDLIHQGVIGHGRRGEGARHHADDHGNGDRPFAREAQGKS